jgi:hypothetical protein
MWTLLELALIADVASSASATAQNTALASAPEYVKEAHFLAQSLYHQKINEPRPMEEGANGANTNAVKFAAVVFILVLFALGAVGAIETATAVIFDVMTMVCWVLSLWANTTSTNSEFEEKAKREALQEAWDIVSEKLAKEDAIRNAMYSAAAR